MYRRRVRIGFTLVELLVVIAIIGVLVGLLLPAVQAAREAARRMQCGNNLKQLGLAVHNYESIYKTLPPALQWSKGPGAPAEGAGAHYAQWSWGFFILPYLEQSNVHRSVGGGDIHLQHIVGSPNHPDRLRIVQTPLPIYLCPSDVAPPINTERVFQQPVNIQATATSNYVGACDAHQVGGAANTFYKWNGIFQNIKIRFGDVTDGLSNTIAIGERRWKYLDVDGQEKTAQAGVAYGISRTNSVVGIADALADGWSRLNSTAARVGHPRRGFSSMHAGGAQFVLGDGSIHFISENIDSSASSVDQTIEPLKRDSSGNLTCESTYERLIAMADGQVVKDF